jgi:hypothetical protein
MAVPVIDAITDNGYANFQGKASCMDIISGDSLVIVKDPAKEPKGARNGVIVLDNGVGLAAHVDPTFVAP